MKYAMLKQQPLLRVQVAVFFKKKNNTLFFFKERNTSINFLGKKTNKWIKGTKNAISKLKDGRVRKRIHKLVRGQISF